MVLACIARRKKRTDSKTLHNGNGKGGLLMSCEATRALKELEIRWDQRRWRYPARTKVSESKKKSKQAPRLLKRIAVRKHKQRARMSYGGKESAGDDGCNGQ